jgi:hypothetical protein
MVFRASAAIRSSDTPATQRESGNSKTDQRSVFIVHALRGKAFDFSILNSAQESTELGNRNEHDTTQASPPPYANEETLIRRELGIRFKKPTARAPADRAAGRGLWQTRELGEVC